MEFPRGLPRVLALILALAYAGFTVATMDQVAGDSDPSGYFNSARLLDSGLLKAPVRTFGGLGPRDVGDIAFQPLGFNVPDDSGWMCPTYPPGEALHLVAGAAVAGWPMAAAAAHVFVAFLSGWLFYLLLRHLGLPWEWAAAGVVLLLTGPQFLWANLLVMSDGTAMAWSLAALYCALRARDGGPGWSLACGLAASMAVAVRPTNLLLAPAVVAALGWQPGKGLLVALGALPGGVLLGLYNHSLWRSPWTTGYGSFSGLMSLGNLPHNLAHVAFWLPVLAGPVLALAALCVPFTPSARTRGAACMAVWIASLSAFYLFYQHTGEKWWYLRFLLPVFPAVLALGLLGLRPRLADRRGLAVALLAASLAWNAGACRALHALPTGEHDYPRLLAWMHERVPPGAVILCMQVSGALYYYTDRPVVRWDFVLEDRFPDLYAAARREGRPVWLVVYDFESERALRRAPGPWVRRGKAGAATLWERDEAVPAP